MSSKAKSKRNPKSKRFSSWDEWCTNENKRVEVVSTNVDTNVDNLKKIPVEKTIESKALIKDGLKIDDKNQSESIGKEKSESSSSLKTPETQTKVELNVSKSHTKNDEEICNDNNSSKKKKDTRKNSVISEDKVNSVNKLKRDNNLEATSSISKNDEKPTTKEKSKNKNHSEDRKKSSKDRTKTENHEVQSRTSKTDYEGRSSRDENKDRHNNRSSNKHEERYLSLKNKADNGGKKNENRRREKSNNEDKSNNAFNMQKIDYNAYQPTIETENNVLLEIEEDLFKLSKDTPLAHCVAEDLRMGAGIAVDFKRYFGGVGKLIDQKLVVGNVGIVKRHGQIAFYLITKKHSHGKPTMLTLKMALQSLLQKMKEHNLTKLGIPKIGCGLDGLDWSAVQQLITNVFTGSGICITVCIPARILDRKPPPPLKVYITPTNLWEMEAQTDIILFIDLDQLKKKNWMNDVDTRVNSRYQFKEKLLVDVENKKCKPGGIISYDINKEKIICVFTSQTSYYSCLEEAFIEIKKKVKGYRYFAFQSGQIKPAENFKHISWIVLILRSIINDSELWLTGDTDQSEVQVSYDQYSKTILGYTGSYSSNFNSSGQMYYNKPNDDSSNDFNRSTNNQNWKK